MNSYLSPQTQLLHLPFSPSICAHLLHHISVILAQSPFCLLSQLFESRDSAVFIFRCSGSGQNLIQKSEQMSMECKKKAGNGSLQGLGEAVDSSGDVAEPHQGQILGCMVKGDNEHRHLNPSE